MLFLGDLNPMDRFEAFERLCYLRQLAPTTAETYWTTWLGVKGDRNRTLRRRSADDEDLEGTIDCVSDSLSYTSNASGYADASRHFPDRVPIVDCDSHVRICQWSQNIRRDRERALK